MTREERCWADLCKRLQRDPATSEESDTCTLRVAFKHAIAFADAETAAIRERAARAADAIADIARTNGAENVANGASCAAEAIRALSVAEEVANG